MSSPHAAMGRPVVGIDFGTTNSVIATLQPDGSVATARYAVGREVLDTFRSVLCFWTEHGAAGRAATRHAAGPRAIEAYLEDPLASRLIMSIKSYLAQRSLMETRVFGRSYALDQLVGLLLDGRESTDGIIRSAMMWDVLGGVARRAWARNPNAMEVSREVNRKYPGGYHITLPYSVGDDAVKSAVDALFNGKEGN